MLFTSISFIYYFLPILFIIYFIVPNKIKNYVLLIFSIFFYFYGEPKYIILMFIQIILSYIGGLLLEKKKDKLLLATLISIHILFLIIFKYTDFILLNINSIFKLNFAYYNIVLPLGISFYTFQIISYLVDVYKKEVRCQKSILNYATYVILFPQLVAGPIVRYQEIEEGLIKKNISFENCYCGIKRFIFGLSKKVILANSLGIIVEVFNQTPDKSLLFYWLFAISYTFQIYFDFSGYSDMAIGLGKILGFNFPENFDYPLISKSITEFWRRWHMTLGRFFKDYIYIPLGGNKKGKIIQLRNILIVWFITGFWHGADYNFIIWGLLFGLILIIEKNLKNYIKISNILKHIITFIIIMISFVIFYGGNYLNNIFGLFNFKNIIIDNISIYYLKDNLVLLICSFILATPILKNIIANLRVKNNNLINILEIIILFLLLMISTSYLIDSSYNPFLYFKF